jgi:hypothetical protein
MVGVAVAAAALAISNAVPSSDAPPVWRASPRAGLVITQPPQDRIKIAMSFGYLGMQHRNDCDSGSTTARNARCHIC